MPEIIVTIKILTDDPLATKKAVHKYLEESLESDFLQGHEEIISIETDFDNEAED
jgi:hypothetical protein